ncbi:MAG TPA: hypothetical protein VF432_02885 [Thermoanaerobaculia bacterium]
MDLRSLDQALVVTNKTFVLTEGLVPGLPVRDLLITYNRGQPMVVTDARKHATREAVKLQGRIAFLNVPAADVDATFRVDAAGKPQMFFRIQLIGQSRVPDAWKFSTSFPSLPAFQLDPTGTPLDEMQLSRAAFTLATAAGTDETNGAPLVPGLNFSARLRPSGLLALFDSLLGGNNEVLLHGTILLPGPTSVTAPLPKFRHPWQTAWPVPGIQLRASLEIDATIGRLRLHETSLRVYCPPSKEWMKENPTYRPTTAITGALEIPSAGIRADASAIVTRGGTDVLLDALFDGVRLDRLEALADLANGSDLFQQLPDEVKSAGAALGGIELQSIAVALSGAFSGAGVQMVYVQVGMPAVRWRVIPDALELSAPQALFLVTQPFSAGRKVGVILSGTMDIGGALFDVSTEAPGFLTHITMLNDVQLPLARLFRTHLPELPAPPDLSINDMQVIAQPGREYSFTARMADEPGWQLDFGGTTFTIENVEVQITKKSGRGAEGVFAGTLEFDDALVLDVRYETPGDFFVRADLPAFRLSQLIAKFDQIGIPVPSGFDFALTQSYVLIGREEGSLTFQIATIVPNVGLLAFTAQREQGWGVAALFDVTDGTFSDIPGLGPLSAFEDFVGLERFLVLYSTLNDPEFAEVSAFAAPPLQGRAVRRPPKIDTSMRGFSVFAQLSTAKSDGFRTLASILGVPIDATVTVAITVSTPNPTRNSRLFLTVDGRDIAGIRIDGSLGILLQSPSVGVFFTGRARASIQGQDVLFHLTAYVLPNGVLIAGSMQGTIRFGPIQLSNLALIIGSSFEAIPSFGVAATIDVADFESSVAVFFDSVEPSRSLLAGAIDGASLLDVAEILAGQGNVPDGLSDVLDSIALRGLKAFTIPAETARALDERDLPAIAAAFRPHGVNLPATSDRILLVVNTAGSVWHITDMTTMNHYRLDRKANGIEVTLQAQFYAAPQNTFIGALEFPQGFHVFAEIQFLLLRSEIRVAIDPNRGIAAAVIVDPIVIVDRNFFSLDGTHGTAGPLFSVATYSQPNPDPRLSGPHVLVAARMTLLSLIEQSTYIAVDASGFTAEMTRQVTPGLHAVLQARVRDFDDVSISGKLTVGIDESIDLGPLGSIPIDVELRAGLSVWLENGHPKASLDGRFEFAGVGFSIPSFEIPYADDILEHITDYFRDHILNALLDYLGPDEWIGWIKDGIIVGIVGLEAIGRVLFTVFKLSAGNAARFLRAAGGTVAAVAGVLKAVASLDPEGIAAALVEVGESMLDIADALRQNFELMPEQIAEILDSVGAGVEDIVAALGDLDASRIAGILKNLQYAPADIARAFLNVLHLSGQLTAAALKAAGYGADVLGPVLKDVFGMGAEAVASALNALGLPGDEIAGVLKNAFGWSVDQATRYFKDVLGYGADAIESALGAAGYAADAVSDALGDAFDWAEDNLNPSEW